MTSVGKDVKRSKPGDHVGVGCMVDSCQKCLSCEHGHEQYCPEVATFTYNHVDRRDKMPTYGGYEVIKIKDINNAYERMLKSDVKCRFVIDIASLKV